MRLDGRAWRHCRPYHRDEMGESTMSLSSRSGGRKMPDPSVHPGEWTRHISASKGSGPTSPVQSISRARQSIFNSREKRDKAAAKRFFIKAIGNNGEPEKITLDGYQASPQAGFELKAEGEGRSTGPAGLGGGARSMKYYLWTISVLAAPFTEFAPEPVRLWLAVEAKRLVTHSL